MDSFFEDDAASLGVMARKEMSPYRADLLNPFRLKNSPSGLQILKVCLMTLVLPLRLLLMILVLSAAWIACVCTLAGLPPAEAEGREPLSGWRRRWVKPCLSRMCRLVFFIGGYVWVPQKGRRAPRGEAPVLLVVPHSSFLDTALVPVLDSPGLVVKDIAAEAPFFGDLIRYTQPLFVSSSPDSQREILRAIRRRVTSDEDFDQLMLFPEGGCGNRRALLHFKVGAFSPGVPVQPVFVRYKNDWDTVTWTWDGPEGWKQLWFSLTQFRIYCEIEFLPVYAPSEVEKKNARLFADNVQHYVSSWTGCPPTRLGVEEARFLPVAGALRLPPTLPILKFLRAREDIGRQDVDPKLELQYLLERNGNRIDVTGGMAQMAEYLGIHKCPKALKEFFRMMNQAENKELDVRYYAACLRLLTGEENASQVAFQVFDLKHGFKYLPAFLFLCRGIPSPCHEKSRRFR